MISDPKNRKYLEYAGLGVEIAVSFSVPIVIGYLLDERYQTSPWLLLAGILIGILLMLSIFVKIARDTSNQD